MKKILLAFAILVSASSFAQEKKVTHSHQHATSQKYTCKMHPEVVMNKPGKCPKCEMTLVPMKKKSMKMGKSMGNMKM